MTDFLMDPARVIHSPFRVSTATQRSRSQVRRVRGTLPTVLDGLRDVTGFSHIFLPHVLLRLSCCRLLVRPFLDGQRRGLFATRYPCRPNPIGLSVVGLRGRRGNVLEVEGIDVLGGTPLLDIKAYVPEFDVRTSVKTGWYATRSRE